MSKTIIKPAAVKAELNGHGTNGSAKTSSSRISGKAVRVPVMKTYKIFIGGKFPRTESGRYYQPKGSDGKPLANICRSSRKDVRDAVIAARGAVSGWAGRSAFNRGQILYRISEMLEGRRAQFVHEIMLHGGTKEHAEARVSEAIDRWIHYAGWCDKYQAFQCILPAKYPISSAAAVSLALNASHCSASIRTTMARPDSSSKTAPLASCSERGNAMATSSPRSVTARKRCLKVSCFLRVM